jgi:protease-4
MTSFLLRLVYRFFAALWHMLDTGRRVFSNLLFLLFVAIVLAALIYNMPHRLEEKTALVLNLRGNLVEQHAANVDARLLAGMDDGLEQGDIQLRDILQVLEAAAHDPKITSVVLLPDELRAAGLPMLREVAAALERFKASGKPVIAWGSSYDQRQYFLASHANEVLLDPMGHILLEGFGHYRNYYRDALDKLGITVNLMRVGTYKSFAEPFVANGPSPAALEADRALYAALWNAYTDEVEKARKLPEGSVQKTIDSLPQSMAAAHGDAGKLALSTHWTDGLKTRDELRQLMIAKGVEDSESKTFRQISFEDYLDRQKPRKSGDAVAVIVAEGEIRDGKAPAGAVGGLSTAKLIRTAREDDQIKSVVLRVNSPGGSAYASELIRRELELTRAAGKPVVISMSNLAASGGYWVSLSADEVIADPTTVTGSIGVFALFPTADKMMGKIGVHTDGVTTTWLADAQNPLRPLDPRFGALVQSSVNHIYDEFTSRTAAARKTTLQQIDAVAQGRVWTGRQARERGLVDRLGSYADALQSAATRAKLGTDFRVTYLDPKPTGLDRWTQWLGFSTTRLAHQYLQSHMGPIALLPDPARNIVDSLSWLSQLADGHSAFLALTHCLCQAP